MLKIFVKTTAKSFLDRFIRRENTVLFEWCSFSSATYVRGFCYVVVDFLRGSGAEKKIFIESEWIQIVQKQHVRCFAISHIDLTLR